MSSSKSRSIYVKPRSEC